MKKLIIALIAAAAIAPVAAQAESYIGANIGRGENKLNVEGVGSLKDKDTSFKIYGGYNFNKYFGVEGGFADVGTFTAGTPTDNITANPRIAYFVATGTIPVAERFSLFGKVGVMNARTEVGATGIADETLKNTGAMFGVGTAYLFTPKLAGVVEYENFGKTLDEDGVDIKSATLTVGLRYKF